MIRIAPFIVALSTTALVCALAGPASAKDPGQEAYMVRVLACAGPDAKMETYLPQSIIYGAGAKGSGLTRPTSGYYALDLTEAGKGKVLEPVRVSVSADKQTVIVDQYTRKLPVTRIPAGGGGTVDFDQRFGTAAECGPFNRQE
jgi:hypothetical protein